MNAKGIGMFLILVGFAGIVIPLFMMALRCDQRTQELLIGVMISASILLGSGSITLAIANKEQ